MRALILVAVLSMPAFAQEGVWTGYVGGWKPLRPNPTPVLAPVRATPRLTPTQRDWWLASSIQYAASQQAYFAQMNLQQQKAAADAERLQRERDAADLLAREQALQVQRANEQALVLAEQQRRIAELERREYEKLEREAADAKAQLAQARAALEAKAQEEREKEIAARELARLERAREDERNGVKGPNVYRWVDEDGVMHFSTKPPKN